MKITEKLRKMRLRENEEGLTTVEYALLLAVIALVALLAFSNLGDAVKKKAQDAANQLNTAGG